MGEDHTSIQSQKHLRNLVCVHTAAKITSITILSPPSRQRRVTTGRTADTRSGAARPLAQLRSKDTLPVANTILCQNVAQD